MNSCLTCWPVLCGITIAIWVIHWPGVPVSFCLLCQFCFAINYFSLSPGQNSSFKSTCMSPQLGSCPVHILQLSTFLAIFSQTWHLTSLYCQITRIPGVFGKHLEESYKVLKEYLKDRAVPTQAEHHSSCFGAQPPPPKCHWQFGFPLLTSHPCTAVPNITISHVIWESIFQTLPQES